MDPCPSWQISQALGCRPTLLKAERKCACARDRLFWCDFEIIPGDSEYLSRGPNANELVLPWAEREERLGILEEGWEFHPQFGGVLPTFLGWRQWTEQPKDVRGLDAVDHQQKLRWAQSGWASAVNVWHDQHMVWPIKGGPATESAPRILSPEEMERAMGFPVGWSTPSDSFIDAPPDGLLPRPTHILRRDTIGNAIAVPILSRLILALLMALRMVLVAGTPRFPQWADPQLHTSMTSPTTYWSKPSRWPRPSPTLRMPSTTSGGALQEL